MLTSRLLARKKNISAEEARALLYKRESIPDNLDVSSL
jgi:hypothetical protein